MVSAPSGRQFAEAPVETGPRKRTADFIAGVRARYEGKRKNGAPTHGFDDQGRMSDGEGVLQDWWAPEDAVKFEAQAARLGAQYEAFEFKELPGLRLNGRLTMGENIADLGGLLIALDAYRLSLGKAPAPVIDGFTGEQRLFMGWAQVWRTLYRDDSLRQQIVNGPHSPGQVRAFAPLRNVDAWYEAFGVEPGDKNYVKPEDRVRIW